LDVFIQQPGCPRHIVPGKRVFDGLIHPALVFIPLAGSDEKLGGDLGQRFVQALSQKVGKEMVIAIPLSMSIERDQEEIGPFES